MSESSQQHDSEKEPTLSQTEKDRASYAASLRQEAKKALLEMDKYIKSKKKNQKKVR